MSRPFQFFPACFSPMKNLIGIIGFGLCAIAACGQSLTSIRNADGVRLVVADEKAPILRVILPGAPDNDKSIEVIFPEHVTVRLHGSTEAEHLYMFTSPDSRPNWHQNRSSVEYEMGLGGGVHFVA